MIPWPTGTSILVYDYFPISYRKFIEQAFDGIYYLRVVEILRNVENLYQIKLNRP